MIDPSNHRSPSPAARVAVPLWLKLGVTFGALVAGLLLLLGWLDFRTTVEEQRVTRRERMLDLSTYLADGVDGDLVTGFRVAADMETPAYQELRARLRAFRDAHSMRWAGIYARHGTAPCYLLDAEDEEPLPINYPVFERWDALERAFAGEAAWGEGLEDEWGRWDSAFSPILDARGEVAAALGLDLDADWLAQLLERRLRDLLIELALAALCVLLASALFARYMGRHLERLAAAAREVAGGDLEVRVAVASRDEVGVVAAAFNDMVGGLQERDLIRDVFGRYVNEDLARQILSDPAALQPGGELREVTILMSDLRGFTSLSERLSPARMIALLNDYLGSMAEIIVRHEGTVIEFIGDAILTVFGAPVAQEDDARRAVACAVEMQIALAAFNAGQAPAGQPPLEMGIGVHTGEVIVGNIGSEARMKYGLVGDAVNLTARVESFTVGGEVLISDATRQAIGDAARLRGPFEAKAKGKKEPLQLYAVQSVGDLVVPAEELEDAPLAPVDLPARCWRVAGKSIQAEAVVGRIVGLDARRAVLVLGEELVAFENIKLSIDLGPSTADDLYAKVKTADPAPEGWRCALRFTSVPEPHQAALAQAASL